MDNINLKFTHLSEKIFASLKDEDIAKCTEVSKLWCNFFDHQKFWAIRLIKAKISSIGIFNQNKAIKVLRKSILN